MGNGRDERLSGSLLGKICFMLVFIGKKYVVWFSPKQLFVGIPFILLLLPRNGIPCICCEYDPFLLFSDW